MRIIIIETRSEALARKVLRELAGAAGSERVLIERVDHMGDINNVSGQAGAVGSRATSRDDGFVQLSMAGAGDVDLARLAASLEVMRAVMKRQAGPMPTVEQDDEIGRVASAELAAQEGDYEGVLANLRRVGLWTLKVARETGAEIVALTLAHIVKS